MPQPQARTFQSLLPTAAVMLAASVVLGLAYNRASPLGVHSAKSRDQQAASPAPVSGYQAGYLNQTISLTVEGVTPFRPSATGYENQTLPAGLSAVPGGPVAPPAGKSFPQLTWLQTKLLLGNGRHVLVDARTTNYFQAEHIPGAVSLPAYSPPADVAAFTAKYPKKTPLVIYCASASCPMSQHLAEQLASLGYSEIKVMPGGFAEYRLAQSQPAASPK